MYETVVVIGIGELGGVFADSLAHTFIIADSHVDLPYRLTTIIFSVPARQMPIIVSWISRLPRRCFTPSIISMQT